MFANLLAPLRAKLNLAVTSVACYAAAGIAGVVAIAFGIAALHAWLATQFDSRIIASLIVAAGFIVLAIIPLIILAMARSREEKRQMLEAAKARRAQWVSPATLSLGLQAARMLGRNKGIAAAGIGALLAGWLISQMVSEGSEEDEAAEPAE